MFCAEKEEAEGICTPRGGITIYPSAKHGKPCTEFEKLAPSRRFKAVSRR